MEESISIRKQAMGVAVNVTQKADGNTVHWKEIVLGPTPDLIATAVRLCRKKCAMLTEGIALSEENQ